MARNTDRNLASNSTGLLGYICSIVLSVFVVSTFSSQSLASGKFKQFSGKIHIGSMNRLGAGHRQAGKNIRHKITSRKLHMRGKQTGGLSHLRSSRPSRYHGVKSVKSVKSAGSAKVINVSKLLSARHSKGGKRRGNRIKVTTYSNPGQRSQISGFLVRNGYGLTAPEYDDIRCEGGYDCIIRLGNSPSSPKIIVIGQKRAKPGKDDNTGPKIIYPPS